MKQICNAFTLLLLVTFIFSCDNKDDDKYFDYDFTLALKTPDEIVLDTPFKLNLFVTNVDTKNTNDVVLSIKNIDNFNVMINDRTIGETEKITLKYDEIDNVSFLVTQKSIKEDSLLFSVSNSKISKEIKYILKVTDYIGLVSIIPTDGGEITGRKAKYNYDDDVLLKATPIENYIFKGWYNGTNELLSSDLLYSFKFKESIVLYPKFERGVAKIIIPSPTGGMATGAGDYLYGEDVVLNALPDDGFAFDGWFEDDKLIADTKILLFKAKNDRVIEARFKNNKYTVTIFSEEGGTVTGEGIKISGEEVVIVATPGNHHIFDGLYENGILISSEPSYSFKINRSREFVAKFIPKVYIEMDIELFNKTYYPHADHNVEQIYKDTKIQVSSFIYKNNQKTAYYSGEEILCSFDIEHQEAFRAGSGGGLTLCGTDYDTKNYSTKLNGNCTFSLPFQFKHNSEYNKPYLMRVIDVRNLILNRENISNGQPIIKPSIVTIHRNGAETTYTQYIN